MKRAIVAMFAAALSVVGCAKSDVVEVDLASSGGLDFSTECDLTRVSTTSTTSTWKSGDFVGIYDDKGGISGLSVYYLNVKYKAYVSGDLVNFYYEEVQDKVVDTSCDEIRFRQNFDDVLYTAYYPYRCYDSYDYDSGLWAYDYHDKEEYYGLAYSYVELDNHTFVSDVSNQSDLGRIDLLVATDAEVALSETSGDYYVKFDFKHMLSMMCFNVTTDEEDLQMTISGVVIVTTYCTSPGLSEDGKVGWYKDLYDDENFAKLALPHEYGSVTIDLDEISEDGSVSSGAALINPFDVEEGATLTLTDKDGTELASFDLYESLKSLAENTKYTFDIDLSLGITAIKITPWGKEDVDLNDLSNIDIYYNSTDELYQIYTAEGLKAFADLVNGKYNYTAVCGGGDDTDYFKFGTSDTSIDGKLMNDVDLQGSEDNQWTTIGSYSYPYKGTFDGDNHEVSGLYINDTSSTTGTYKGLFGYIYWTFPNYGRVKNLTVSGSVTGYQRVGGVAGGTSSSYIENCVNKATVSATYTYSYAGGVVGYANSTSRIYNSTNMGTISGVSYIGGISGDVMQGSEIIGCTNSGTVTGSSEHVGGVVGYINGGNGQYSYMTNCSNSGAVNGSGNYSDNVGGVVGYIYNYSYLTNCSNSGAVNSNYCYVGGVAGCISVSTSYITNCYNRASVYGKSYGVGGVVGYTAAANVSNCYNTGAVSSDSESYIGGVVGVVYTGDKITNCYFDSNSYPSDSYGGKAMTTEEMTSNVLTSLLNSYATTYNATSPEYSAYWWEIVGDDYPTFTDSEPTDDSYDIIYSDGIYLIYTATGMKAFANWVNGTSNTSATSSGIDSDFNYGSSANPSLSGKLMCDITLSGTWTPIGSYTSTNNNSPFTGYFNGNGYKISGLYVNGSSYMGLFGYINGATIINLGVSGIVISTAGYVGGLVGQADLSYIMNCYNECSVTNSGSTYNLNTGGVVGYASGSSIINCYNEGIVKSTNSFIVGGVVGATYINNSIYSTITNCYNRGSVSGLYEVGGIVGELNYCNISYCYNATSEISITSATSSYIGGVVGDYSSSYSVTSCYYLDEGTLTDSKATSFSSDDVTSGLLLENLNANGTYWKEDTNTINDGYPILLWQ